MVIPFNWDFFVYNQHSWTDFGSGPLFKCSLANPNTHSTKGIDKIDRLKDGKDSLVSINTAFVVRIKPSVTRNVNTSFKVCAFRGSVSVN